MLLRFAPMVYVMWCGPTGDIFKIHMHFWLLDWHMNCLLNLAVAGHKVGHSGFELELTCKI